MQHFLSNRTVQATSLRSLGNRLEHKAWSLWMDSVAALSGRWWTELGDCPFAYNETASVSHLCSAATHAGLLGLAEYAVTKKRADNRRFGVRGRCDLWLSDHRRSWAFEFKQLNGYSYNQGALDWAMDGARHCARHLRESEADFLVAGVVASMWWHKSSSLQAARPLMLGFARRCDFAWRVSSQDDEHPETYLYFNLVR